MAPLIALFLTHSDSIQPWWVFAFTFTGSYSARVFPPLAVGCGRYVHPLLCRKDAASVLHNRPRPYAVEAVYYTRFPGYLFPL